jgi:hypothetical protein
MPFRINTPDITHELLDGEVIVVHVVTGSYYSLNGSAATIWGWIDRGAEVEEMASRIADLNGADREAVAAELRQFTDDLQAEGLISRAESSGHSGATLDDGATSGIVPFSPPKLEKYSDMEELLLVDPIHEVTPQGWPERAPGNS